MILLYLIVIYDIMSYNKIMILLYLMAIYDIITPKSNM